MTTLQTAQTTDEGTLQLLSLSSSSNAATIQQLTSELKAVESTLQQLQSSQSGGSAGTITSLQTSLSAANAQIGALEQLAGKQAAQVVGCNTIPHCLFCSNTTQCQRCETGFAGEVCLLTVQCLRQLAVWCAGSGRCLVHVACESQCPLVLDL